MRRIFHVLGALSLAVSMAFSLCGTQVSAGANEPADFSYGARVDLWGQQVTPAVNAAAGLNLGWIAVDFNWGRVWPDQNAQPDLQALSLVMAAAQADNLHVLMSITNAPAWAMTPTGPETNLTVGLVLSLAQFYSGSLSAVELFPGPNTVQGWGAAPSPAAFAALIQAAQNNIQSANLSLLVVPGGLTPLSAAPVVGDVDDITFLQGLYQSGAAAFMPILGVRFAEVTGDPLAMPTPQEHRSLRHIEEIRKVMLDQGHQSGLIWITGFSWPTGAIQPSDMAYQTEKEQALWVSSAYRLLRAQLYVGAAFFTQLNPSGAQENLPVPANSIIHPDGTLHPAAERLSQFASLDSGAPTVKVPGSISKKMPGKSGLKPPKP